ncbi:MAG: nitroreductase family protein [Candidatus Thorarchaeota archaeon]|nr:MAG: nitroreductase family protein [Candidatus Thorarchaeota archaeon]
MTRSEIFESFRSEEFFQVVGNRRSIRRYKEIDIPQEDIAKILEAARLAPSTNNTQPWKYIVVKEQATKDLLTLVAGNQRFIADANTIIVAIADKQASCCPGNPSQWHILDTMIATEHVVLAATALGYGSCWIAMLDSRNTENVKEVKNALRIPEAASIVALVLLGVPDESPSPISRKTLEEIAFHEAYGLALGG